MSDEEVEKVLFAYRKQIVELEIKVESLEAEIAAYKRHVAELELKDGGLDNHFRDLVEERRSAEARIAGQQQAMNRALSELINVQPHIAQLPKEVQPFVDVHLDVAIEHLRAAGAQ
jgi:chromosome segregation ATPase